jgi:hypothetical protein
MTTLGIVKGTPARAIRALERDDIEQAADLYEAISRSGKRRASRGLAELLERTLFDHPWADPDIPSLVYEHADGRIIGFIASHVRRFTFDGTSVRAGCCGQLVTDLEARSGVVGTLLIRAYMAGDQDLTFTDTASPTVRRLWEGLGGEAAAVHCVGWFRAFRPWASARDYLARRDRGRLLVLGHPLGSAIDAAAQRLPPLRLGAAPPGRVEELTPELLIEALPEVSGSLRLLPAYDETFLHHLFAEMATVSHHGELVRTLVRDVDGRPLGWYVYYRRPGAISSVLQVAGHTRDLGTVLDHLFHDAASNGSAGLQGRVEPRLIEPLAARRTAFHASGYLSLVHARRPELLAVLASGLGLMTRMEGEWWMGYHLLSFADRDAA